MSTDDRFSFISDEAADPVDLDRALAEFLLSLVRLSSQIGFSDEST